MLEKMIYPKILVINGEPFNMQTATGITMCNLFRGWPKERIAQIYSANIPPESNICNNNWKLSNGDLKFISGLRAILGKSQNLVSLNTLSSQRNKVEASVSDKIGTPKTTTIRKLLTPIIDLVPYSFNHSFLSWLTQFKPDIIYTTLGNIRLVRAVEQLSKHLSAPVVPHFMDDWLATYSVHGKSCITILQRHIIYNATLRILSRAPVALAICDTMADEYREHFNVQFEAFMNSVTIAPFSFKNHSGPIRFVYIGGLHLSRWKNLVDIATAIDDLRDQGISAELIVYAPLRDLDMYHGSFSSLPSLHVAGSISPEEVSAVLAEADVAVHVESFEPHDMTYTRLSVSTKIPQYMASGRPILAYGPADVASCRYIDRARCGTIVGERRQDALREAVRVLATNNESRQFLGLQGWKNANEYHDRVRVHDKFVSVLASVVQ